MKLFAANCKIVRGQQRACLIDLQHQELRLIPLILADFLEEKCTHEALDDLSKNMLLELESLEMVLEIDDNERSFFPDIPLEFDMPYAISNAILDYNSSSHYNLIDALKALENIRCPHIEIRFYDILNIDFLHEIGETLFDSTIDSIDLYIPYSAELSYDELEQLKINNIRFRWIFIHSVPENYSYHKTYPFLKHTTEKITDQSHCGVVHYFYFEPHISVYTESQHRNTCLNRKVSIDTQGRIKNCPSMEQSFGHIHDTSLEDVISNSAFTKVWNIKKDEIEKCKGCEFRHICTDCRAYLENPDDLYSAPLKCGYNPETCEWEDWSTNPLKEKSIQYYHLQSTS